LTQELRQRAIRLLARREHSRAELARKLAPHGGEEDIQRVLDELQAARLQSDARFAESYVRTNAERLGNSRLRYSLMTKGVSPELIAAHLGPESLADELDRARIVWQKKFCHATQDASEWAKQARFLQGRGFANDIIRKLLKETAEEAEA
jgi:regulatory protein